MPTTSTLAAILSGGAGGDLYVPSLFTRYNASGLWIPSFTHHSTDFNLVNAYQDNEGTTDADADSDPVGLVLDESQGAAIGAELVTNGTFDADTTGWVGYGATGEGGATLSVVSQTMKCENNGVGFGNADAVITVEDGSWYKIVASLKELNALTSANLRCFTSTNTNGTALGFNDGITVGDGHVLFFKASGTTAYITLQNGQNTDEAFARWDDVTCQKVSGNHAYQSTDASRLTLVNDAGPGSNRWAAQGDGSAGHLVTGLKPATSMTMIVACEFTGVGGGEIVIGSIAGSGARSYIGTDNSPAGHLGVGLGTKSWNDINLGVDVIGVPGVVAFRYTPSAYRLSWLPFGDSEVSVSGAHSETLNTTVALALMADNNGGSIGSHTAGYIFAAFAIQAALTDAEIAAISNVMSRAGV